MNMLLESLMMTVYSVSQQEAKGQLRELVDQGIDLLLTDILPVVFESKLLLGGVVLLVLALVVELINGLLDMVVYTALAGGFALLMAGAFLYAF